MTIYWLLCNSLSFEEKLVQWASAWYSKFFNLKKRGYKKSFLSISQNNLIENSPFKYIFYVLSFNHNKIHIHKHKILFASVLSPPLYNDKEIRECEYFWFGHTKTWLLCNSITLEGKLVQWDSAWNSNFFNLIVLRLLPGWGIFFF